MTATVRTRCHFGLILAFVVLFGTLGFASDKVTIHIARLEYWVEDCDNPSNPLVKSFRTAGDIATARTLVWAFVGKHPGSECAKVAQAEFDLAQNLEKFLQNQGITTAAHPGQYKDVQKALLTKEPNTDLILHCVIGPDFSSKSQVILSCSALRLNGDPCGDRYWSGPNLPLDKIKNLFDSLDSQKREDFFALCNEARTHARR